MRYVRLDIHVRNVLRTLANILEHSVMNILPVTLILERWVFKNVLKILPQKRYLYIVHKVFFFFLKPFSF